MSLFSCFTKTAEHGKIQTLAIKYCIAITAFYIVEQWHFKYCNNCNIFLRGLGKIHQVESTMLILFDEYHLYYNDDRP
jgi:hypothetical protein